jgi:hypothetical protein
MFVKEVKGVFKENQELRVFSSELALASPPPSLIHSMSSLFFFGGGGGFFSIYFFVVPLSYSFLSVVEASRS